MSHFLPINRTNPDMKTRTEMCCVHEAGHALIAYYFGIRNISIDMKFGTMENPETEIKLDDTKKLTDNEKLIFYMGGYAAEEYYVELVSKNETHFAYPYARNWFNQNIDESIELDMKKARYIISQDDALFDRVESDALIKTAKSHSSNIVNKNWFLLFVLHKELMEAEGFLAAADIAKACSSMHT